MAIFASLCFFAIQITSQCLTTCKYVYIHMLNYSWKRFVAEIKLFSYQLVKINILTVGIKPWHKYVATACPEHSMILQTWALLCSSILGNFLHCCTYILQTMPILRAYKLNDNRYVPGEIIWSNIAYTRSRYSLIFHVSGTILTSAIHLQGSQCVFTVATILHFAA